MNNETMNNETMNNERGKEVNQGIEEAAD